MQRWRACLTVIGVAMTTACGGAPAAVAPPHPTGKTDSTLDQRPVEPEVSPPPGRLPCSSADPQSCDAAAPAPRLSGICEHADIRRVVAHRQPGLQVCYEKRQGQPRARPNRVIIAWRIGPDGSVPWVSVRASSLRDQQAETCMIEQIRRWKFAKPTGGLCQIQYPFVFDSSR